MKSAPRHRAATRLAAPALAVLLALLAGGCSGEQQPATDDGPELTEPSDAPTLAVEPVTTLGRVTGRLPRQDARAVEERVSGVALDWLSDAYVGGSYPRENFENSFPGFSRGARAAARRDLAVMTNARVGRRTERITPTKVDVTVDLLAVDRRAVGATARVLTTFRTEGQKQGRYRVAGRLVLTKDDGRWTVFGYHVSKGGR